jgi:tripartite-type tricarboxylate transporter receptor subunit TctC
MLLKRILSPVSLALALCVVGASAQTFPTQPIKLVVGFAPGGPADISARIAADIFANKLGTSVVVENRAGASGAIAATAVAGAKPDGHTLLVNVTADIVNPAVNRETDKFITNRFVPVALISATPNVLVVHPSVAVKTAKELVAYMRVQKESMSYASAGLGTVSHLAGVLFSNGVGTSMVHVPYKGTSAAQVDLLAGRVPVMFDSLVSAKVNSEAGKVKALAVTSLARWPSAADLPTLAEAGLPETDIMATFGIVAPAGTPAAVVNRLSAALLDGMKSPDVRKRFNQLGAEPGTMTPSEYRDYLNNQTRRWVKLANEGKIDLIP